MGVVAADVLLLLSALLVYQDLGWRTAFASSPHAGVAGYAPSFSLAFLQRFLVMQGSGVALTSPPTLDWIQLIAIALAALNGWCLYALVNWRRRGAP